MRIAVKLTLMVCISLLGGLTLFSISWLKYSDLESVRATHLEQQLAMSDALHLESSLTQWLDHVDRFFSQRQQQLASDIARNSLQLRAQLNKLQPFAPAETTTITSHLTMINQLIKEAATSTLDDVQQWNLALVEADNHTIAIANTIDGLHTQIETTLQRSRQSVTLAEQNLLPTLASFTMGYIMLMALLWLWLNQSLSRPLLRMQQQALKPLDEQGTHFNLFNGPHELQKLAGSLNHMNHRLLDTLKKADKLEQQFESCSAQLESFMQVSPDAIVILDQHGTVISLNRATRDQFNLTTDAAGQTHISELLPGLENQIDSLSQLEQQEQIGQCTDGSKFALQISSASLQQSQGGVVLVMRNITEQKLQQLKIRKLNEKLVSVSKHAGVAEVATETLDNISQILDSANNTLSELQTQSDTDDQHWARLQQQLSHAQTVINTQHQLGQQNRSTQPIDVANVLNEALTIHKTRLQSLNIEVARDYQPAVVDVEKSALLQIVDNLIRNAIDAIAEQNPITPRLQVRIRKLSNARLGIDIVDNGIGLTPEQKQKLFRHGFTTKSSGHGFGLNSCAIAARNMRGEIQAVSEGPGHGCLFRLQLPAAGAAKQVA